MTDWKQEIRERLDNITPGEWEWQSYMPDYDLDDEDTVFAKDPTNPGRSEGVITLHPDYHRRDEDLEFIAKAPEYVSRLLDEVDRLNELLLDTTLELGKENQGLIDALKEVFEYSKHDGVHWLLDRCYVVARKALEGKE